ncbi:MAG: T9SS type A sorting domain-containing protein, partial [Paramuribaculum sp.]|nr:T9SS type A sorting domain-containing protein [Paramuribaculum sp.]
NTSDYMTERADNTLGVAAYSVANSCFWELIPAEGKNCYYIRNVVSGRYIASCNRTPSSSSVISTTDTPVAYYIGLTSSTSADIAECYYLSSTDCTNYDSETRSPRALNKDGSSSNIIAWQAGSTGSTWRVGSYWKIVPATESYEVRPFTPSESAAAPAALYQIYSPEAKALSSTLAWGEATVADKSYQWSFVGSGNAAGYQIVNAATGECVGGVDSRYAVFNSDIEGYYSFRPVNKIDNEGADLTIDGVKAFRFAAARSSFALAAKIYTMPCGSVGNNWLNQTSITGESVVMPMYYPADIVRGKKVTTPSISKPTHWFTLFTTNKATVAPGKATVSLTLRNNPAANLTAMLYFDWNGDGYFETSLPLEIAKTMETEIEIPEGARTGECRMRLRLTTNGLTGAEDTTDGQVVDFIINVTDKMPEDFDITLLTNSPTRGTATLTPDDVAVATPLGTSTFVCWKEGNQVLSVDSEMKVERTYKRVITAVFSPNLNESTGIDVVEAAPGQAPVLSFDGVTLVAESLSGVNALMVFDLNGSVVASTKSNSLNVSSLPAGIYVAKVFTPSGSAALKIAVKN